MLQFHWLFRHRVESSARAGSRTVFFDRSVNNPDGHFYHLVAFYQQLEQIQILLRIFRHKSRESRSRHVT